MFVPQGFSLVGAVLLGGTGLGLALWALSASGRSRGGITADLDRLFADITRGLRVLSGSTRYGGFALMAEKHDEVARLLSELQARMRMLEDGVRDKYEEKAHRILAQAARFGITLPPP